MKKRLRWYQWTGTKVQNPSKAGFPKGSKPVKFGGRWAIFVPSKGGK